MPLIIASTNRGKLKEFEDLFQTNFGPQQPHVQPISDFTPQFSVDETGQSFAENALIKANAALAISRLPAMGDDSGLCVNALNGEPGVRSARWLGDNATDHDRNAGLLDLLRDVPIGRRAAFFECVLCIAFPDGAVAYGIGRCHGEISMREHGAGGFGYDPIFVLEGAQGTFAELTSSEKNKVSHRTLALRNLKKNLVAEQYTQLK